MLLQTVLLAAVNPPTTSAPSFTISVWWLFAGGFFTTLGVATWKFLPWVVKSALEEKIDSKLLPMVTAVHDRIDAHMDTEESSFDALVEKLDQTQLALEQHMDRDEVRFAAGAEMAVKSHAELLARLDAVTLNTDEKVASIRENADENSRSIERALGEFKESQT